MTLGTKRSNSTISAASVRSVSQSSKRSSSKKASLSKIPKEITSSSLFLNADEVIPCSTKSEKRTFWSTPHQQYISRTSSDYTDNDSISTNSDGSEFLSYRQRLKGGAAPRKRKTDNLILSPSQCKIPAPGFKFLDPKQKLNVVVVQLNDVNNKPDIHCRPLPQRNVAKTKTRATQTLYRESSAQTLPYLPGVSNETADLENLEIFKLPSILPGDGPPGLYEVEVLERARRRWAFANALKENFRKQLKEAREQSKLQDHEHILEAFEWEHWIEREEYIQECQMLRLELLIRMFDKREREMHMASTNRIETMCEQIEAKRKAALKKNEIEYNRAVRCLEIKHAKQPRVWRKEHITQGLGDPTSEFYAPKMRYGINPSRRHYTGAHKGFDMRMDNLEKKAIKMDPKNLKCPFAKLREWSKPKVVLQEVEQNFCTESNLKKLYESLRTLRESSKKQKYIPLCLKAKQPTRATTVRKDSGKAIDQIHVEHKVSSTSADTSIMDVEEPISHVTTSRDQEEEGKQKISERFNKELKQQEKRSEELEILLSSYEGNTIGWLMRFLSEEMCRLKEQRKLHFFTMMAKRQRWHREAAEAGLRQKENCIRRTYENLYQECDTINKEAAGQFLNSVINIDMKDYVGEKAEQHIVTLARELDKEVDGWLNTFREIQNPFNYYTLRHALKDIMIPDAEKIIAHYERDDCIKFVINDVLFGKVYNDLEPYDITFTILNELVDRLIDNDLFIETSPSSSEADCLEFKYCTMAEMEAKALLRKLVRYAVPGRRWLTEGERVGVENVQDLLDTVFDQVFANNGIVDIEMKTPPYVESYGAHVNLLLKEKDIVLQNQSTDLDTTATESSTKVRFSAMQSRYSIADITQSLTCTEKLLLDDPERFIRSDVLIHVDDYAEPETPPKLSLVHRVPSSHDLSRNINYVTFPSFYASSDELVEEAAVEETGVSLETNPTHEEIPIKQPKKVRLPSPPIMQITSTKQSSEEPKEIEILASTETETDEKEAVVGEEDDDSSNGVYEAFIKYDPDVKYSVAKL